MKIKKERKFPRCVTFTAEEVEVIEYALINQGTPKCINIHSRLESIAETTIVIELNDREVRALAAGGNDEMQCLVDGMDL